MNRSTTNSTPATGGEHGRGASLKQDPSKAPQITPASAARNHHGGRRTGSCSSSRITRLLQRLVRPRSLSRGHLPLGVGRLLELLVPAFRRLELFCVALRLE